MIFLLLFFCFKDLFIGPQEFVVGYSKAPEQPQNSAWPICHIDHAGPFLGAHYLVLIDSHSKWMEVEKVSSTAIEPTIRVLQRIFATHGLPDSIVSDNGTAFTSQEFSVFCKANGIRHIRSAPRHPSTNGLAKRAVQVFKILCKENG